MAQNKDMKQELKGMRAEQRELKSQLAKQKKAFKNFRHRHPDNELTQEL